MDANFAAALNRTCACVSTDDEALRRQLTRGMPEGWAESVLESHANLFAALPVFITRDDRDAMQRVVQSVERVARLPRYAEAVLANADESARVDRGPLGVFFGYDFHLGPKGPQLIEVNTNAGGALLQLALAAAQTPCCPPVADAFTMPFPAEGLEDRIVAMFRNEHHLAGRTEALEHVAIVDEDPSGQFLHPEFELFRALFERNGIRASIVPPEGLVRTGDDLHAPDGTKVDLVYLRSTDFALRTPSHAVLRRAHLDGVVVVTPPPRAHALVADKANLVTFGSASALAELGADPETIATLTAHVPESKLLSEADRESFWAERKQWFVKPRDGFGSKAAYRGDKLTRGTWDAILADPRGFVAQRIVPPSERVVEVDDERVELKADIRCFAYDGSIQLVAARLYRGQTTNMRTEGGGLAAVMCERETGRG